MIQTGDFRIYEGKPFGNIMLESAFSELCRLNIYPGDSVDVCFSNGQSLTDIPYLSGCVLPEGMVCLNAYDGFDWIRVEKRHGQAWQLFDLKENDTGRICMREPGKYLHLQDMFSVRISVSEKDYPSEEYYTNYRELRGGKIKEKKFYRGTASFDPYYNKTELEYRRKRLDGMLERDHIQFILNMTCEKKQMESIFESGKYEGWYIQSLYDKGRIYSDMLPADYSDPVFLNKLADALQNLLHYEGPYMIECRAGLDRTGFLSCVLEALAGATYSQIEKDYMMSYECLCGLTKEKNPEKYESISRFQLNRILEKMNCCSSSDSLSVAAYDYLRKCGMKETEISRLMKLLTE